MDKQWQFLVHFGKAFDRENRGKIFKHILFGYDTKKKSWLCVHEDIQLDETPGIQTVKVTNDDFVWLKTATVSKFQREYGPQSLPQDEKVEEVKSNQETTSKSEESGHSGHNGQEDLDAVVMLNVTVTTTKIEVEAKNKSLART